MKKLLIVMGIFCITGVFADYRKRGYEEESPTCSSSKSPVCCECYVPNYYDLQCASGVFFYGDFLYWFANEDNLAPCVTAVGTNFILEPGVVEDLFLNPTSVNHLGTKWDPGFRAAWGINFEDDGFDVEVNYTWFQNKKHKTFSVPGFGTSINFPFFPDVGQMALVDPWINIPFSTLPTTGAGFGPLYFQKVNAFWKLKFQQIDLQLGRKFWLGKRMAMRAYTGARGVLLTTRFNNVASNVSALSLISYQFSDKFKNRIWGGGILVGIQPEWHFCQNFILFSNVDASLLWGKLKIRKKEEYNFFASGALLNTNFNTLRSNISKMQAIWDLALGLRWEGTWCNRIRTSLDIAWEEHILLDTNNRFKNFSQAGLTSGVLTAVNGFESFSEEEGNLMMGGAVVRFRVDF